MKERMVVKYQKVDEEKPVFKPEYKTEGSSGMDLCSAENTVVLRGETKLISTNLSVEIPKGYEIQIRPRSGLAAKHSITVLNSPGTIDSDYRGEIKIILHNAANFGDFHIAIGDRIAQAVLAKVEKMEFFEYKLSETERGSGGFGHTGTK